MNFVIVFDHPYGSAASENVPHRRSYSAALLAAVTRGLLSGGHQVDLIDLHADGFNPVTSASDLASWRQKRTNDPLAADYQRRLMAADHIILIFPIWWEGMPALLKGFFDKVFVKGVIYAETKPGRPFKCLLPRLQGVSMLTVMATPTFAYRLFFGNPIAKMVFRGTFRKMGVGNLKWYNYSGMENRSLEQRQSHLAKTERIFATRWKRVSA
ncbi:NAD(P)H-dependent oxidoreductase [Cohnella thailandensis]|uniref:NAD(P)H-dependent oxidoreductase n=1 Tax=Cohnella thailandensis TaxID=557557 RepID=A0A841SMJ3_9BACL|nr:NAD(P)H-dependent oxidoreductase [Cohnella thailandensis]MBB6633154.1 NAD(P)H-dependent oxidoreductase [Cohnella thailandensis]MBP1975150.1 putative NADPH-quinone reductase [Cohnella thailandensis]